MPTHLRTVPLDVDLGTAAGHRLRLLSIEVWDEWMDVRFARIDEGAERPLPRRVPPAESWTVRDDRATPYEVVDAVGRGDRAFSNGEVRVRPSLAADTTSLTLTVEVAGTALTADVPLTPEQPRGDP